jgi:hypothetical protein
VAKKKDDKKSGDEKKLKNLTSDADKSNNN